MTGYSLSRWKSPFSGVLSLIISSTLFVPFQVYMVSLIVVVNRIGLTGNILGLILVYIALGMPVPVFLCLNYVKTLPKDMEEAATIDGCSRAGMFFKIIFPVMKPITATVAVLNGLWVWGEFLVAFLVYGNHKPMTLPLSQQYFYGTYSNQWNLILAGFVICAVPVVIFYLVMQKYIIKGVAAGAVKE
jgi:raffinose/stachyose/melibiose transport system permease protein